MTNPFTKGTPSWCEWEIENNGASRIEIYDFAERYRLMAGIQNNCSIPVEIKRAFQYLFKIKM